MTVEGEGKGDNEGDDHFLNNSINVKAVFFKLGTSNVHHKRNRMTPFAPVLYVLNCNC